MIFSRMETLGKVKLELQNSNAEPELKFSSTRQSKDLDFIEFSVKIIEEAYWSRGSDSETYTEELHTEILKILKKA